MVNCFIVYELDSWLRDLCTDFTLGVCLFRGVKLAKNSDPDNYVYSSYGAGFNARMEYSLLDSSIGKKFYIFGADMSSLMHIDN